MKLQCCLKIKIIEIINSNHLSDYLTNFIKSIENKKIKANLHIFDSKPSKNINLAKINGVTNYDFVKQLMCIDGISEPKAIAIVKCYPMLSKLYDVYLSDQFTEEEKMELLENCVVDYKDNGTTKKLGKAISLKVYQYYCANSENDIIP